MGQITPNMSIYVPAAGETNYDASFLAGMVNVDQHNHTGGPNNGVQISTTAIADGSITAIKFNANVVNPGGGLALDGATNAIEVTGLLTGLFALASTGLIVQTGANTAVDRSIVGTTNQIAVTNGNGVAGNPTLALSPIVLVPTQPKFLATLSASQNAVTGDGTLYQLICDNSVFDTGSNYSVGTGAFTAPVTGKYLFLGQVNMQMLGVAHNACFIQIATTARTYQSNAGNVGAEADGSGNLSVELECIADMTAGDTAVLNIQVFNSTKTVTVFGQAASLVETNFTGTLLI